MPVDVHAWYGRNARKWRITGFAGPSFFRLSHEMVANVRYQQLANVFTGSNQVAITTYDQENVSGSNWGMNAGADAAYFFSRSIGVGAGLRFNYGTITVNDPLSKAEATLVQAGLRASGVR